MMKNNRYSSLFLSSFFGFLLAWTGFASPQKDLSIVKERLTERCQGGTAPVTLSADILAVQPDGSWADVDYADQSAARWKPDLHMKRLITLARAVRRGAANPGVTQETVAGNLLSGLDYWLEHDPQSPNWWWNTISVPRSMYTILLLAESTLDENRLAAGCRIIERARLGLTGQNLVWRAECNIARGCLENNPELVAEALDRIEQEIRITTEEGIQPDFSFYQHDAQFYSGGYGKGFAINCASFAAVANETAFAFSDKKTDILVRYLLDGEQWMIRNRVFDYSACGREIVRTGGGSSSSLESACRNAATLGHPRTAELEAFADRVHQGITDKTPALTGNRFFPRVEYMAHHRPKYFASVRMASKRVKRSEFINGENTQGEHLSDGVNYLYCTGEEYRKIMPVWDWHKLPGITAELDSAPPAPGGGKGERSFAGGVSDGQYGFACMDFANGSLTARKAWFFFDDEYVCLGAGIRSSSDLPVATSLNQCLQDGPVTADNTVLSRGEHHLNNARWVHHAGTAYVFPNIGKLTIRCDVQAGSWHAINRSLSEEPIKKDVFSAWIDHSSKGSDGEYAYIVVPAISTNDVTAYAKSLPVKILANRPELQAVVHPQLQRAELAFYVPGSCDIPDIGKIGVNKPCALMAVWSKQKISLSASNPDHKEMELEISVAGHWDGATARISGDHTIVQMALSGTPEKAGSTVTVHLTKAGWLSTVFK